MDAPGKYYAKGKRADTKDNILDDVIHIKYPE